MPSRRRPGALRDGAVCKTRDFEAQGASVIGIPAGLIDVQREFSTKECRDKFPVGADPSLPVINAFRTKFEDRATASPIAIS